MPVRSNSIEREAVEEKDSFKKGNKPVYKKPYKGSKKYGTG
jgi:hypothetical protein